MFGQSRDSARRRNGGCGLIFDCDGVRVDSEPLAAEELAATLRGLGLPIGTQRIYDEFLGRSVEVLIETALREHGTDLRPAMPGFAARLEAAFRRRLGPIRGMAEALQALAGPRAVASSSGPERLALSLRLTGLGRFFGAHVYSAAMVARGKPAPDLFLHAARGIGVAPENCIVIEDSPAGIRAARAAGMRVIGFLGGSHAGQARLAERLAELRPDALIEHAADLPNTLARLD